MVTLTEARRMALSLPEATEQDHHGMASFRVDGKVFTTVPDDRHLNVMLDAFLTHAFVGTDSKACEELWWGRTLSGVHVDLDQVRREMLADLLEEAWLRRAPKRLRDAYKAKRTTR